MDSDGLQCAAERPHSRANGTHAHQSRSSRDPCTDHRADSLPPAMGEPNSSTNASPYLPDYSGRFPAFSNPDSRSHLHPYHYLYPKTNPHHRTGSQAAFD